MWLNTEIYDRTAKERLQATNKLEDSLIHVFVKKGIDVEFHRSLQTIMLVHIIIDPCAEFRNKLDDSDKRQNSDYITSLSSIRTEESTGNVHLSVSLRGFWHGEILAIREKGGLEVVARVLRNCL